MNWTGLARLVAPLRARALELGELPDDPRVACAAVLSAEHGLDVLDDVGRMGLINIGVLAIQMRERLIVHEIRRPVPSVVASTDLHSLPEEPPRLLRTPCILEVRDPKSEALFDSGDEIGATCALGCYALDDALYLVGLQYPDGIAVVRWCPRWGGGELGDGIVQDDGSLLIDTDTEAHAAWGREAARFLVVLGLLLDAEHSPVATTDDAPGKRRKGNGRTRKSSPWAVRRVYLDGPARSSSPSEPSEEGAMAGRLDVTVPVTGHLKRQPYGPGRALRKWVYVAGYEARRWVAPKPMRVIVGTRGR